MEIDSLKEDEARFEKRWWTVGLIEEYGWRIVNEKKPNENNGRDETVVWEVELFNFTNGAAQGGARTCRSATDSMQCRLSWKDKFTEFRVFRNCGRWSAKCNTTMVWSMSLSWCRGFFPPFKNKTYGLPRELGEESDCMCSENCVVWTSIWAQTLINVDSSPPRSFLLKLFVTSFWKKSFPLFHFFPPYSKNLMNYFLFWTCFPWSLESWKNLQFFFLEGSSSYLIFFLFLKSLVSFFTIQFNKSSWDFCIFKKYLFVGHFDQICIFACLSLLSAFDIFPIFAFSFFVLFLEYLFFLCFSFWLSFLNVSLFWRFSLFWLSLFSPFFIFSFYIPSCHSKKHVFLHNFRFCCLLFFEKRRRKKRCFLQLPVSPLHYEKLFFRWKFVLTHFETSAFFLKKNLHFHHHQCNTFPFWTSALPFNSLLLFILYPLVLFFWSLRVFLPFLSPFFRPFEFSLVLDVPLFSLSWTFPHIFWIFVNFC